MKKGRKAIDKKKPITHELIFKIMLWVTFLVAGGFLLINLIKLNVPGIIAIGGCLLLFAGVLFFMKKTYVKMMTKEFVVALGLEVMIFAISLFSGESYSDDFPMFLAAIAMTGMYMEPTFTKVQIVVADILLVAMYIINPGKAESLSQYILCLVIFTLAGFLLVLAIKRGRAFIDLNREQALVSENVLWNMQEMGNKIQTDFNNSSVSINESTRTLQKKSETIIEGAATVADTCDDVRIKVEATSAHINELNLQVKHFEEALSENEDNMNAMKFQLRDAINGINETNAAVTAMKTQMNEVAAIAEQLGAISFKTTLLSLNAAVEASHAGAAGAGFAVVASEMKDLSENSDRFAERVAEVVSHLLRQVENISEQFDASTRAIELSEASMGELQESFDQLNKRFDSLYDNIELQTSSVDEVNSIFGQLKADVDEMKNSSAENRDTVEKIVQAMDTYRENIDRVVKNTKAQG